jgi:hypothetical protein
MQIRAMGGEITGIAPRVGSDTDWRECESEDGLAAKVGTLGLESWNLSERFRLVESILRFPWWPL